MASIPLLAPGLRDEKRRHLFHPTIKDHINFLKYGTETDGAYSLIAVTVAPGGGTPLHYHNSYTESFLVSSGTLGVVVGSETLHIEAGGTAHVPPGTKHRFFNPSETEDVKFEGKVEPAHEGFEQSVYIIYGMANDGLCDNKGLPKSFATLCLMAQMGDMKWPGLIGMIGAPLIWAGAAWARWTGTEKRLLERYWC